MRSHSFLRKSHLLLTQSPNIQIQPIHLGRSLRYKRLRPTPSGISSNRSLSTSVTPPDGPEPSSLSTSAPPQNIEVENTEPDLTSVDPDKVVSKPRRPRVTTSPTNSKEVEPPDFPLELEDDILYVPTESQFDLHDEDGFPPLEMFHEALDNLMIALHPQNQYRSVIPSGPVNQLVEPTLGLYCPIEGGDYVVDLTVQELAYKTGAEVLVLDSVQLAAGEWGLFGKAASALHLPNNPLHFSTPPIAPQHRSGKPPDDREDDFEEEGERPHFMFATPARISLALPKVLSSTLTRGLLTPSTRKAATPSKLESFFEGLVNLSIPPTKRASSNSRGRPRLIYIRDFPTLAPSSSIWYPPLLAAVRQRRRKMLSRTSNLASSPVAIVFGMTPSVTPPGGNSSGASSSLINLLMNRTASPPQMSLGGKQEHTQDWGESEVAESAREKRLRNRLRRWEKNAASLHEEFPSLSSEPEAESAPNSNVILLGAPDSPMNMPPHFSGEDSNSPSDPNSQFFRSSILVPRSRSTAKEREARVARRREINELTMRMGVGAIGGIVEPDPASSYFLPASAESSSDLTAPENEPPKTSTDSLWEDWGNKVEVWSDVRRISDRAMGSVMASPPIQDKLPHPSVILPNPSTVVPWSAIVSAWKASHSMSEARRNWLKETIGAHPVGDDSSGEKEKLRNAGSGTDKVVETIKNDPDLDAHESRLLPCIVDSLSITTTFKQVHLPSHTIDSVRTIVSLPLLHPNAFKEGILKEHSMTGCLLFGPPGTGKTLAVRALAKEAGCRMLAISPSDVMDMYVGEGEKLVRAVFSLARKLSPCVIFLDEIDALFGARMSARDSGSAFAHRGIITEFMQEMDGLKSSKEDNVIVIGATNRPFDLDDAVLRRLPRRLLVDLPGEKERKEILRILLRDETLAEDVTVEVLSKKTDGFSGSDLKHLCVSAALDSIKENLQLPWLSRHNAAAQDSALTSDSSQSESSDGTKDVSEISATSPQQSQPLDKNDANHASSRVLEEQQIPNEGVPSNPETPKAEEVLEAVKKSRTLHLHNFTQALKEITPSSSESLGSLADLRKWNEEFGEGRKDRKKRQVWGKGRFGFVNHDKDHVVGDGRVAKE